MMHKKAVVNGGSITGLLTARVLSDHFEDVVLIEKDKYSDDDTVRHGTPQANHIHLLLVRGKEILMDYFPDLEKELIDNGANKIDFLNDGRFYLPSGWAQRFESGVVTFTCTRTLLENSIRHQMQKIKNIIIQDNTSISSFISEGSSKICLNVSGNKTIHADLIVDCTGRNTGTPQWLEKIDYPKITDTRVDSFVGYATRRYIPPKDAERQWKMLSILSNPTSNPRLGAIYPIEHDKWLVFLSGIGKTYPPIEEEGFLEFAKNLENNELHDAMKDAIPDSEIHGYRVQGSRRYHYELMSRWPENFIVLGDAVAVFNPFYGQGITSAALGVKVLDDMLGKQNLDKNFTKKFQKRLAKTVLLPWVLGTSEDLRWPTTVGRKPNAITRLVQNHAQRVLLLGPKSKLATKSFLQMMHMIRSPAIIFHPIILLQLVANAVKK